MQIQPFAIETEAEARAFLADLLQKPERRSQDEIKRQCDRLVRDPALREFFQSEGARMLADLKE